MKTDMEARVPIMEGVTATFENGILLAKGKAGEVQRPFSHPRISFAVEGNEVVVSVKNGTKRDKMFLFTYKSHVTNTIKGAAEGFVYELKICSGHFPMTAKLSGQKLELKNFLGEAYPRTVTVREGVKVEVKGDIITVESSDKEKAGQMAAVIESMTRITNRDRRIFQDGIYITKKAGKEI